MAKLRVNGSEYKVKGILFDKDGTLLDFIHLWGKWCEIIISHIQSLLMERYDITITNQSLAKLFGIRCDEQGNVIDYYTSGLLSTGSNDAIVDQLKSYLVQLGLPQAEAMRIAEDSRRLATAEIDRLRPVEARVGLVSFLKMCSSYGLRLAVVTADDTAEALKHLKWLGIEHYFLVVIGHDMVANGKPSPDMVHLACARLGLSVSEVVVVGDSAADMKMGKDAGVASTIAILPESGVAAEEFPSSHPDADERITSYEQLKLLD